MKTNNIKITPKWEKSKDEIWNKAFADLQETNIEHLVEKKRIPLWRYIAASAVVIVFAVTSFAFLYTTTETIGRGSHLAFTLPDGSKVDLNAESQLSYKPYWWYVSRNVKLNGEAYFEVEKGSTFGVQSGQYAVHVLGTSFNVFSRSDQFNVTCLTGKVNVSDKSESVILTPNMQAVLDGGKLKTWEIEDAKLSIEWKKGKFVFVGVPLKDVIQEIERQYNIKVSSSSNLDYLYSGNFTKTKDPNDVLQIVGKPFGIEFKIE